MSNPPDRPDQQFNIDGASIDHSQIGGMSGRDINQAGRDLHIHNYPGKRPRLGEGLTRQEYINRQRLLQKVKDFWVKGVLQKSLHEQVLIQLGLEERPNAISLPWGEIVEAPEQPLELPLGTSIISIFDQIGIGRSLLILGEPGSGKTITLLQLARDLLDRAEQNADYLIPVVLNLSAWQKKEQQFAPRKSAVKSTRSVPSITDWLIEELSSKYQVPPKIGEIWVKEQHLLLLLDGLDGVRPDQRDACISALNSFQQEFNTEMVVCCRLRDYEAAASRLKVQHAIYLIPLNLVQARHYLSSLSADLSGLKTLLLRDTVLQHLAQSPLMLNIMALVYQGISVDDLPKSSLVSERQKQLFDIYISRMFKRPIINPKYPDKKVLYWLRWLAKQMIQESQTEFLIEKIQPTWLQSKSDKIVYQANNLLISTLISILISFAGIKLSNGLSLKLASGLIFILAFGLIFPKLTGEVKLVERLSWSWQKAREQIHLGIGTGLIFGVAFALIGGVNELVPGLVLGPIIVLSIIILGGLIGDELEVKTVPNQGVMNSAINYVIFGLFFCSIGGLIGLIYLLISFAIIKFNFLGLIDLELSTRIRVSNSELILGIIGSFGIGLIWGLRYGGAACIQHLNLRWVLYRKGYIPWNYAQFLDYATERLFLQKVGGGYIFIHRSLMEHFAQLDN